MKRVLVVAPHPDDETLGCGGTIAKLTRAGHEVYWAIVTRMPEGIYPAEAIERREIEIQKVKNLYTLSDVFPMGFPAAGLGMNTGGGIVASLASIVDKVKVTDLYVPFFGDAHSDHRVVYDAAVAAGKSFRHPSVERMLCYETLSETNFGLRGNDAVFVPTVYEDITDTMQIKKAALDIYASEMAEHPFPRSYDAVNALAVLRGSECGVQFAEAFMLMKEIRRG